jgi:hypothetical protein
MFRNILIKISFLLFLLSFKLAAKILPYRFLYAYFKQSKTKPFCIDIERILVILK